MLANEELDVVIASTPNKFLKDIVVAAANRGIHILCEKPLGRNLRESTLMVRKVEQRGVLLKTGFNHRYHPALLRAHEICSRGEIGSIYLARCIYGHGGRPGYETEWRASRDICGGGELLDQGVHVVDLFRWFMGEFSEAFGTVPTYYWPMDVEDNGFALFKTSEGQVAFMHTSWTQWKNRFVFEIFGESGYIVIDGLGGSYGVETLKVGKRRQDPSRPSPPAYLGGTPDEDVQVFEGPDESWNREWEDFRHALINGGTPLGTGRDGLEANRMIDAVYQSARRNRPVAIHAARRCPPLSSCGGGT